MNTNVLMFARKHAPAERIMRIAEVVELLGVSRSTVLRWSHAGRFAPIFRLGPSAIGFRASEVQAWIEERAEAV